jgi:hypothetical protein
MSFSVFGPTIINVHENVRIVRSAFERTLKII